MTGCDKSGYKHAVSARDELRVFYEPKINTVISFFLRDSSWVPTNLNNADALVVEVIKSLGKMMSLIEFHTGCMLFKNMVRFIQRGI